MNATDTDLCRNKNCTNKNEKCKKNLTHQKQVVYFDIDSLMLIILNNVYFKWR